MAYSPYGRMRGQDLLGLELFKLLSGIGQNIGGGISRGFQQAESNALVGQILNDQLEVNRPPEPNQMQQSIGGTYYKAPQGGGVTSVDANAPQQGKIPPLKPIVSEPNVSALGRLADIDPNTFNSLMMLHAQRSQKPDLRFMQQGSGLVEVGPDGSVTPRYMYPKDNEQWQQLPNEQHGGITYGVQQSPSGKIERSPLGPRPSTSAGPKARTEVRMPYLKPDGSIGSTEFGGTPQEANLALRRNIKVFEQKLLPYTQMGLDLTGILDGSVTPKDVQEFIYQHLAKKAGEMDPQEEFNPETGNPGSIAEANMLMQYLNEYVNMIRQSREFDRQGFGVGPMFRSQQTTSPPIRSQVTAPPQGSSGTGKRKLGYKPGS